MRIQTRNGIVGLILACMTSGVGCSQATSTVAKQAQVTVPSVAAPPIAAPRTTTPPKPGKSLRQKAADALMAGDTKAATKYASRWLKENTNRKAWYYGNTVHEANQILGLAALQEGRLADARRYLIAAGKTPGSPQLNSFGPPMALAQQVLAAGEKATVIQYLDLVAKFWAYSSPEKLKRYEKRKPGLAAVVLRMNKERQQQIDSWKRQIRVGKKPKLHNSDSYF